MMFSRTLPHFLSWSDTPTAGNLVVARSRLDQLLRENIEVAASTTVEDPASSNGIGGVGVANREHKLARLLTAASPPRARKLLLRVDCDSMAPLSWSYCFVGAGCDLLPPAPLLGISVSASSISRLELLSPCSSSTAASLARQFCCTCPTFSQLKQVWSYDRASMCVATTARTALAPSCATGSRIVWGCTWP
uniref:Uncharacterized protein n=1 Tax=Peronospora matthiolae TaxID=2874970 RepID=A0AAV1TTP0_9STRA